MRKFLVLIVIVMTILIYLSSPPGLAVERRDVIVYGGGFAGCAAARNAAALMPEKSICLIVPESAEELGGLGTSGGQNFTDIRIWRNQLVTQGSFMRWFTLSGQFYNTRFMAEIIQKDLAQYPNLSILYGYDILAVSLKNKKVNDLYLADLADWENGSVKWGTRRKILEAKIFIDASDDGRLAMFSGAPVSNGREDWPSQYLPEEEKAGGWYRQQAATLMFKVTGVQAPSQPGMLGEWVFTRDALGSWGLAGGKETWRKNPQVIAFNEKYRSVGPGFAIKPINAAQDGAGSSEWWVNTLLVFNVDGRVHDRDKGTVNEPRSTAAGYRSLEQGRQEAQELLQNPEFIETLRQFTVNADGQEYGFGQARLILDEKGKPVVGKELYIRETVHARQEAQLPSADSENTNYAVTAREAQKAGSDKNSGEDQENYAERIGLGYYMMDINAYSPEDLKKSGTYDWPVTRWVRPDWAVNGGEPQNPVYLPYSMLTVQEPDNLLLAGYAVGCSSFAWAELRVLPNLAVLGDAAGVAAARAVLYGESPRGFKAEQIRWVQEKLLEQGAKLDKLDS